MFSDVIVRHTVAPTVPSVFNVIEEKDTNPFSVQTDQVEATFSSNGLLQAVTRQGQTIPVSLEFVKYGVKYDYLTTTLTC